MLFTSYFSFLFFCFMWLSIHFFFLFLFKFSLHCSFLDHHHTRTFLSVISFFFFSHRRYIVCILYVYDV